MTSFGIMTAPSQVDHADGEAVGGGFGHVVPGRPAPFPPGVARWVADELITAI